MPAQPDHHEPLTADERDALLADVVRDGFVTIPRRIAAGLLAEAGEAIRAQAMAAGAAQRAFRCDDLLPRGPAFRELACIPAVLQLALDLLGPTLQLVHSNLFWRPAGVDGGDGRDYLAATPWHADGPPHAHHPRIDGIPALMSLKVGIFLSEVGGLADGPLQVVRGSHRIPPGSCDHEVPPDLLARHAGAIATLLVPAGSIVLFHPATWHAAPPVTGTRARLTCYLNYGPHWLMPWDRPAGVAAPADWPAITRVLQQGPSSPRASQFPGDAELAPFAPWRRFATRAPGCYA